MSIQGTLNTGVADIGFDQVAASFIHKRDIDEFEDGCIVTIDVSLTYSSGCQFHVVAGNRFTPNGSYKIRSIEFEADSFCPNFPDATEGTYLDTGGLSTAEVEVGVAEVPGYNVATSCVATYVTIRLQGNLNRTGDSSSLSVSSTEITISGDFSSTGDAGVFCPCVPDCQGRECGSDGCGWSCGTCAGATEYCSGNGQCVDDCLDRECGTSPNEGFDCGSCPGATEYCHSGQCEDLGMQWQNPPADTPMRWQDAIDYCGNLSLDGHDDWRLPSISELRSLIRGCAATETGGSCGVDDGCLSYDTCWDDSCYGCSGGQGPADGCYWPDGMEGPCWWYWPSSPREDNDGGAWSVSFRDALVYYYREDNDLYVRCVRVGG